MSLKNKMVKVSKKRRRWHKFWEWAGVFGGIFLVGEAVFSIIFSQDQRVLSNAGRVVRVVMGGVMIVIDSIALKTWRRK